MSRRSVRSAKKTGQYGRRTGQYGRRVGGLSFNSAPAYAVDLDDAGTLGGKALDASVPVANATNYMLHAAVFAVNTDTHRGYRISPIYLLPPTYEQLKKSDECRAQKSKESWGRYLTGRGISCGNPLDGYSVVRYRSVPLLARRKHDVYLYWAIGDQAVRSMRGCWTELSDVMCHRKKLSGSSPVRINTLDMLSGKIGDPSLHPEACMPGHATTAWVKGVNGQESGGTCRTAGRAMFVPRLLFMRR